MSTLGKGLGSLIPNKVNKEEKKINNDLDSEHRIVYLPLEEIDINPYQPRSHFDKEKLDELAESIKKHGILQPIVVSKVNNN